MIASLEVMNRYFQKFYIQITFYSDAFLSNFVSRVKFPVD